MSRIDESEYRKRLGRLSEIFTEIAVRAVEQSHTRCPYRDGRDRCTGKFRCRNQLAVEPVQCHPSSAAGDATRTLSCTHDERFDYRDAWATEPRAGG